jgi:signal transduction histidine kinase
MTASLYLANGKRACGPLGNNPILNVIKSTGKFNEGNIAHYCEQREVYKIVMSGKPSTFDFSKSLRIDAIPIKNRNEVIGVVMLGWVFDHFPDPVECERLSKDLELPPNQLWQMARLQSPVSEEKFIVYKDMLSLLLSTLLHQIVALQKVQEASRVKDELLSIVSHELKTPLSSLLLRIQMLKSHRVDPEKMDSFLNSMEVNARMESKLIDDLLDAARMVTGKYQFDPKLIDLKSTVASAIQVISESARERDIKIKYESTENVASIYGDPIRLSQAVINLINNAIKFSPHGETITVTLKSLSDEFELAIIDNGQGIEQNFIPQMFEIFSQPPRKTGTISNGLGLGMALVKNIIDLHNGKIEVMSLGENLGTKIVIHFPKDEFLKN